MKPATAPAARAALTVLLLLLLSALLLSARESPPQVPPPQGISFRMPAIHRLANGLRIVVIEQHNLPLLTLYALVEAGAEADPPNLPGTAETVADLLPEGSQGRSALEIAQAIDQAGGNINSGAGWDESYVNVSILSDHAELAFDLLAGMLMHPAFAPPEIERARKQTLSALDVVVQDPSYLADVVLRRYLYAGTPYAHSEDGTPAAIRRITRADLVAFHDRNYAPSRTVLAVVGDVTDEQCMALANKFLGAWDNHAASGPSGHTEVAPPAHREVLVVNKPDATQTEIRVANVAVPRSSPHYYALAIADQVLGGPAANRLFDDLRTRHGLTYGASSELKCYLNLGGWIATTSTRSSETIRATEMILDDMKRLRSDPITGHELEMAQNYLIGHEALDFESPAQIANQVIEVLLAGLPLDYWSHYAERLRALNTADVLSITQKYLRPDESVIVLVGNVSAFHEELKKLGPYTILSLAEAK